MSDFIAEMSEASARRARVLHAAAGQTDLGFRLDSVAAPIALELSDTGFDVIAEAKLASPSEGRLIEGGTDRVRTLARVYAESGAVAVSVLTEGSRFAGSLEHLQAAASSVALPVMRKDFLVDPIQVLEARAAGASGVLLIARMLPGELLEEMTDLAIAHGMFVLVEVFDRTDLEIAARVFGRDVLVGVNCRDLATLAVDRSRFESLAPHLPDHLPAVAESGIGSGEDVRVVANLGYRLALVGSSLVSEPDPGSSLSELITAGRNALFGARS